MSTGWLPVAVLGEEFAAGDAEKVSDEKTRRVLGWQPRASEDAIIAAAESLIEMAPVNAPPDVARAARITQR